MWSSFIGAQAHTGQLKLDRESGAWGANPWQTRDLTEDDFDVHAGERFSPRD